jgi:DNA-binding response OmpR family regulator
MSATPRVLLVEDDATLRDGLALALRKLDLAVETAADGALALRLIALPFDLIVLDLMLPGASGFEVLQALRARDRLVPVIVLTARGEESDKVLALELGADDYVTKPFSLRELSARVRAQLRRRADSQPKPPSTPPPFALGDRRVDLAAFRVVGPQGETALSPREAAILSLLVEAKGAAVPRHAILDRVWGRGSEVTQRTIDTHVLNLRGKLEREPDAPRHLLAVHGIGYRLVLAPDASTDP